MTSWQRRLRFAVAAFGLAIAVVVFLAIRRRDPAPPPLTPDRVDPKAQVEVARGEIRSTKGAKNDYKVTFERMLSYANGTSKLMGLTVNVDERGGRSFVLAGREGQVGPNNSWVTVTGSVKLQVSDGLTVETDEASWAEKEEIVRAPGKVTFTRGRMSGSSVGMTYDKTRDVMWLLDQAHVQMEPDPKGGGALDVTAATAGFARAEKYMKFQRAVKLVRDGRIIEADEATAYLTDDEKHVKTMELRGNSRITPQPGGPGSLQQLNANDMNLEYAPDSDVLRHATLSGRSAVQLTGDRGGRGSHIAAETMDIALEADGATLSSLTGREHIEVDFAAAAGQPSRTVKSASLDGRGEAGRGLSAATFTDNVEFRETVPGKPPVERVVHARLLEAVLNPSTAAIEEGKFSGAVRFEENQMTATAAIARYSLSGGVVDLSGVEGTHRPVVADENIRVEARAIQLKPEGRRMVATNDVRSTLQPASKSAQKSPSDTPTHVPGMLSQDEPVSVTGDRLEYDGAKSTAVYTGNARLWQGDTSINGNTLTLDNTKGDLTAVGAVRTVWDSTEGTGSKPETSGSAPDAQKPNTSGGTAKPEAASGKGQTLATGDEMRYEDALRRATYTANAHVVGAQGDVTAAKIELYLQKDSNDLDRVEAYDNVVVKIDKRTSTGARMTFFASDERYVMTGTPVRIVDECGSDTVGRIVTFYKSSDTAIVDGVQSRARTVRTPGGKCPQ